LRSCPRLHILTSSREALRIGGEQVYRLPSLSLPDPSALPGPQELMEYESVRLFVERAGSVALGFGLSEGNAPAVAAVSGRLDGFPLALELAAEGVKALSVEQLAARLDDRFRILTSGSRTALPRQQTLRAMIDWSYDLLNERERALLARLSVFCGEWNL